MRAEDRRREGDGTQGLNGIYIELYISAIMGSGDWGADLGDLHRVVWSADSNGTICGKQAQIYC